MLNEQDRKDVAEAFEKIAKAFRAGHGSEELNEAATLLKKHKLMFNEAALLPLFVEGQRKAIEKRDGVTPNTSPSVSQALGNQVVTGSTNTLKK